MEKRGKRVKWNKGKTFKKGLKKEGKFFKEKERKKLSVIKKMN